MVETFSFKKRHLNDIGISRPAMKVLKHHSFYTEENSVIVLSLPALKA